MENSRLLNVEKHITLAKFLKELSLRRNAEIAQIPIEDLKNFKLIQKIIRIYDNIGNEIYDTFEIGTLISDLDMFSHLDDEVKKVRATDHGKYLLIEIFLK